MDNVLFVPSTRDAEWVHDVLPGLSMTELPVAGRRIIDYAVECAQKAGAMFIEILDWNFSDAVFKDFSDLTRTAVPVFYMRGEGAAPEGLRDLEGMSTPLTQSVSDGLVVVWGPVVPAVFEWAKSKLEPVSDEEAMRTPTGVYRREGGKWMACRPSARAVCDVRTWRLANMFALRNPQMFTLPGYSAQKGVHIGRNVVMERGVKVETPTLLCDGVWCGRNVTLGGNVILGARSYVGEGTRLVRTVVCEDTYIGAGLVFEDKIIIGSRVIDAQTGVWTDMDDPGVARPLREVGKSGLFHKVWHLIVGRSRGRRV